MGIKIPKNKIKAGLYTSGGEFLIAKTQQRYQGYYYEINDKFYIGKEYKDNSPELIKANSDKVNKLLSNPFTYIYGIVSGTKINNIKPKSTQYNPETAETDSNKNTITRYFTKKTNENIIRETDQQSFNQLQTNPIYQIIAIEFVPSPGWVNGIPKDIDKAEQQMPGIKAFLGL
jgi:hypothetical protein